MGRYAKLGTLVVRWTAVSFLVIALLFLFFGVSAVAMTRAVMPAGAPMMGSPLIAQGHAGILWWWPALAAAACGALLFASSRALGSIIGAGLDDG